MKNGHFQLLLTFTPWRGRTWSRNTTASGHIWLWQSSAKESQLHNLCFLKVHTQAAKQSWHFKNGNLFSILKFGCIRRWTFHHISGAFSPLELGLLNHITLLKIVRQSKDLNLTPSTWVPPFLHAQLGKPSHLPLTFFIFILNKCYSPALLWAFSVPFLLSFFQTFQDNGEFTSSSKWLFYTHWG